MRKRPFAWLLRLLGQQEIELVLGVKTQFRGLRTDLYQHDWQEIAEVFKKTPVLEDYLRMQLDESARILRTLPVEPEGDRRRLVLQAQAEVLQDMLNLPEKAAAKAQSLLRPKKVPTLKGMSHAR